ncbi:MAG: N-6 DNA methylase, partial [Clostridiales bacterium]|nr:N-6 DNA methylase [Clostridiales bacterium]
EDERVRYEYGEKKGKLRMYAKGTFIYRLAGREREKSASYYTPEVLTKCLVKYALKELLEGKTADEILQLTVCEPAMGSAAFLNEAINQLAEAYISRKEQETGRIIGYEDRFNELQKVKMYIADRNVYGIDLNPVAVELAEVSLWLNTIYAGGFVPWFGTQLVCGNSLIGARRQVYRVGQLTATSKGLRWYENEPERIPVGTKRVEQRNNVSRRQVYHFLLGDPGMCSYGDKVIKQLEPEAVKAMKTWNKKFNEPYSDDEVRTLLYLSQLVDDLWDQQVELRREIEKCTQDALSIYGHTDDAEDSHTSIRQKDLIYSRLYKSEHMKNAGPYARLKFAMDYWCALWFWPIDKADLLPSRSEFLNDMSLILEGTFSTQKGQNLIEYHQMSLFPSEQDEIVEQINEMFPNQSVVDLDNLCVLFPRMALVRELAEKNRFMHWELEFADLFADRGGFDLVIGNPPWIKLQWKEQNVLAERNPMFAVKKLSATETSRHRSDALNHGSTKALYFGEYESMTGQQNFLNAYQNYSELKGQQTNLYKCFLPQSWHFNSERGVSAFVHPEGVFDDPRGGALREIIYPRLRKHFMFANEGKLFPEVDHHTQFSLNVYGGPQNVSFDTICNLYDASSIVQCYEGDSSAPIPGIKDEQGDWNTAGHPDRIVHISKRELKVFAKLFDDSDNWKQARMPVLHVRELMEVLNCLAKQDITLGTLGDKIFTTEMWHETNTQNDGTIRRFVHFPDSALDMIISGPHIRLANPFFKASRRVCKLNSDYDNIDLTIIPQDYRQRCNFQPACDISEYISRAPEVRKNEKAMSHYRVAWRTMIGSSSERTILPAIIPPQVGHVDFVFEVCSTDCTKPLTRRLA